MSLVGYNPLAGRRVLSWRGSVILVAAFAITLSLANRVFEGQVFDSPTAHSAAGHAKIQHRDSDAAHWAPPVARFTLLWSSRSSITVETVDPLYAQASYPSLYNRPPPTA